jgi:Toprim domain
MPDSVADITRRLAENAEAVCRHYLSNGRREGRYWLVGDVYNTPGRSLYVRLSGSGADARAIGRWTDAATGEYGDLLDLIAAARGLDGIGETLDEARRFLGLARSPPSRRRPKSIRSAAVDSPTAGAGSSIRSTRDTALTAVPADLAEAARRLFRIAMPIAGTLASRYLRARGINLTPDLAALRFHPRCYYRLETDSPHGDVHTTWPALIAAVTDLDGAVTGVQRTWLDPSGQTKAPVAVPRRAMGRLLGHAVRFGTACDILAAALTAAHLAGLWFPPGLRRLYIVRDNDPAGHRAEAVLTARAQAEGIEALTLAPALNDFNDDLRQRGPDALAAALQVQLAPQDAIRFRLSPRYDRRTG